MRTDSHVHIMDIYEDEIFEKYKQYFIKDEIEAIIGIYDNFSDLEKIKTLNFKIFGFFWIHSLKTLPKEIPDGLKFESWIDNILINEKNLKLALNYAERFGLPIIIHCNQLRYDLSRPKFVARIAKKHKDLTFIIAHAGSYAPPLPDEDAELDIMEMLVKEAIITCKENENIFIETSILASPKKRKIILESFEKIEDRILLGTDFPYSVNQLVGEKFAMATDYFPTIKLEENFLLDDGLTNKKLKKIYSNIYKIFSI